jgi:hypothetical protein
LYGFFFMLPEMSRETKRRAMMVEQQKLERIVLAIHDQARLLRRAGKTAEATGMERRAAELRTLFAARPPRNLMEFSRQAA